MIVSVLVFDDGSYTRAQLPTRPMQGEIIHFNGQRYMVKSISHHATETDSGKTPVLKVHLGIGRGKDDSHLMEKSPRGFFTG